MSTIKKTLSKVIINNSIRIFIISILILLSVVLYFFQKEIMYSSMIYGDLALKNSAQSIEKDNAQYTFLIENMERTISFQISSSVNNYLSEEYFANYLKDFLLQEEDLKGIFIALEPGFIETDKSFKKHRSGDIPNAFSVYISSNKTLPFEEYQNHNYYKEPKKTLKSFVSNPHYRTAGEEEFKVYTISYPIIVDGQFAGIIGCDVDIEAIYNQLEGVSIYDGNSSVALLDNNGTYLTHNFFPELIGKNLKEDCPDAELRLQNLRAGKIDQWFDGFVGAITNPIYFNDHQSPWQLQAKVHAKYVFANVISAAFWIIPTIILAFLFFIFRMKHFIGSRIKPLVKLDKISALIADGDLTHDIDIKSDNEIGNLADSFTKMVVKLQLFVSEIQQGSANITSASQQLGASSQVLSSSTNEQASTGEEISSNMEEMSASVQQNADKSFQIKGSSEKMLSKFKLLNEDAQKAAEMQEEIAQLSGVINDIAQNIKILSLNAAVEAARAGEHGKGFAVVAREVQKLSENTTISATKITEKILASSQMSTETMEFIREIVPQLSALNEDIEEINMASQEQASNIQMVTQAT
ncbi:methyl-accepting chemotaxis protein, partial [Marinilabilia sp.]|uniref:methyl-accepting chemotaxis protein n=1 Tax=Marinilabilia sp. TaxID=2021252 RepID=UPI0025C6A9FA